MRDDLPEIVRYAKDCGCKYVQLNSNGVRLAADEAYVKSLADAGLSFVFMQFDGLKDDVYEQIRGRALWKEKLGAIANCSKYNLGVVLVVTVVPGVNDRELGKILRFGLAMSPSVRGVHFQPVTYLGRSPSEPADEKRMTLDELVSAIVEQTNGLIRAENLAPSRCDHPMCGFHGDLIALPGDLRPLTHWSGDEKSCEATADQNREFVGRRWLRPEGACRCSPDMSTLDGFLDGLKTYGFTVTSMAFQDVDNIDVERLRYCSTHVYKDGRFTPLCAYYLTKRRSEPACLHPGGPELTARALELGDLPPGARIADVGCGAGRSLSLLRARGLDAVGVEPGAEERAVSGRTILSGSAEALPFQDEELDALLSECVLSVISDPVAALDEAARVLRPGGVLLGSDLYSRLAVSGDGGILTREALIRRAEAAGFEIGHWEDHTPELLSMAAQMTMDGGDVSGCTGRSAEALRKLKCGYYLMTARKKS